MEAYRGVELYLYSFSNSVLNGDDLSTSNSGLFTPGERTPSSH